MHDPIPRRRFVALLPVAAATLAVMRPSAVGASAAGRLPDHPDPRPGVDASKVLSADRLRDAPDAVPAYDAVREIPGVADGLRCYCGCATIPGYRSLLTCFEEGGMARHCDVCKGQALLAHERWKAGATLDEIRAAVDARYGRHHDADGRAAVPGAGDPSCHSAGRIR